MVDKRKYFDYELAYLMYKRCEGLVIRYGIDKLNEYFEETGDRENGYTTYYGSEYNAWVYVSNVSFDTDKEEKWVVSGEVDMISYGEGDDNLFINNVNDIKKRIEDLPRYSRVNEYSENDYQMELASLNWVLDELNGKEEKVFYIVETLCKDTNKSIYNDNNGVAYTTYERAKEVLNSNIKDEYDNLIENKSENIDYYIIDYIDDNKKMYEREIWYETKDYEDMLTRYTIRKIEVE